MVGFNRGEMHGSPAAKPLSDSPFLTEIVYDILWYNYHILWCNSEERYWWFKNINETYYLWFESKFCY